MLPGISGSLITTSYVREALFSRFEGRLGEISMRQGLRAIARCVRDAERRVGPASSARAVLDVAILPLMVALGYDVDRMEPLRTPGFIGVLSSATTVPREALRVAAVLALPWGAPIDATRHVTVVETARRGTSWALVCNGASLSLVDASRSWSRRSLEIDLAAALQDERSARLLWALARADALVERDGQQSLIEDVVHASDRHATAVCTSLGSGVMEALAHLVAALGDTRSRRGRDAPNAVLEQAITVVYRVLFLLFAEARSLVPTWHRVYREAYTIETLCRRISARADSRGAWSTLQAIARLAHAGCAAGDLRVTAFNGRLFAPERSPLAERARVPDEIAGRVLLSLATRSDEGARRPIAYADLGVEQLGSVYERVLEYEPVETRDRLSLRRSTVDRKRTGTFYTPRSLTDFIVRRTLAPLVRERSVDQILSLRIVDPSMGSGAFLVSACRYLADACERAHLLEQSREVTEDERAVLRRRVAERCLYGVDINPMAVQVARLSLWLTTLAADRPLTFLDHHLAVGDSLVGARFRDLARQPPFAARGSRRAPPAYELFADADAADALATSILPERFRLSVEPADTVAAVRDKERRLAALDAPDTPLDRWKRAADLWCAAWFWNGRPLAPALFGDLTAHVLGRGSSLRTAEASSWLDRARGIAQSLRAFHWELAFPEVFFDAHGRPRPDGGFDAVLGNPPWEVLRADEGEDERRADARASVGQLTSFVRDSGIYTSSGRGHPNSYQLFVERALQQLRPGGRFGMVVPGGLMTDQRSGGLRRALLNGTTLDPIVGFENRAGIFPIHRGTRFVLLAGRHGGSTPRLRCRFGLTDPTTLDDLPDLLEDDPPAWSSIRIDRTLIEGWDPEHLTIPEVTDPLDLSILADLSRRVPALASPEGWHARFGRELNATDDRRHFVSAAADARAIPVIEGKCLEPFRIRVDLARQWLPSNRLPSVGRGTEAIGRARLAYRDVASATNKLTLIAAMLPAGCVSTHTVFCLKTALPEEDQRCLMGLLNSLVANYLVRRWVSAHVTTAVMARLPVPVPAPGSVVRREIVRLATALGERGIDGDVEAYATLNASVARLYELDVDRYAHIVGSFPLLAEEVRARILAAY
jgi:hypothetical protein